MQSGTFHGDDAWVRASYLASQNDESDIEIVTTQVLETHWKWEYVGDEDAPPLNEWPLYTAVWVTEMSGETCELWVNVNDTSAGERAYAKIQRLVQAGAGSADETWDEEVPQGNNKYDYDSYSFAVRNTKYSFSGQGTSPKVLQKMQVTCHADRKEGTTPPNPGAWAEAKHTAEGYIIDAGIVELEW